MYQAAKPQEHAYRTIGKELKDGRLKNVLFFYGREQFLINWAIDEIIKTYINPACKELDFSKPDSTVMTAAALQNICETLPMLSEKRVVFLQDFKPMEGAKQKGFGEEEEKAMAAYLGQIPDSCVLIITSGTADKRKKLYKAAAAAGAAYEFGELAEKELTSFIVKHFKLAGKQIRSSTLKEFVELSGYYDKDTDYTLYNLENDIKKAAAHSSGDEILAEDITGTVSGNLDRNIFAMIDALSKDKKEEAFQLLHNLIVGGEKEYRILALICSQFESIYMAKEMKEDGKSFEYMKKQLGIHEFRVKKAAMFAERYSLTHLRGILQRAYSVDKNIKTGILESTLALEMFIATI